MGLCLCVNPTKVKNSHKKGQKQHQNFHYNANLQLQLQNKVSSITGSTMVSGSTNLFKTFQDWDSKISYLKVRSAELKWQNDRIQSQRCAELRYVCYEEKQRKGSDSTNVSIAQIQSKNKITA